VSDTRPLPYKVSTCTVFDLKRQGIRTRWPYNGMEVAPYRIILVIRPPPFRYFRYKAIDGLITERWPLAKIEGHGPWPYKVASTRFFKTPDGLISNTRSLP